MIKNVDIYQFRDSFGDHRQVGCLQIVTTTVKVPTFSIIIPAYKRADTLETAIRSALAQDFKGAYEVVIINNDPEGAKEGNAIYDLIKKISDNRISYYVNQENIGMSGNWNRAVSVSRSDNIVMVHDDVVLSEFVLSVYNELLKKYDDITVMGVGSQDFYKGDIPHFCKPDSITYSRATKLDFFFARYVGIAGIFFKRHIALEIGGFRDELFPSQDAIFIFQAMLKGRVIRIENCLAGYGLGDNVSMNGDTPKRIALMTEATRRSMANYEWPARLWMQCFGGAFFWQFVCAVETTWHVKLDKKELQEASGYGSEKKYFLTHKLMRLFQKAISLYEKTKRKNSFEMEEYK